MEILVPAALVLQAWLTSAQPTHRSLPLPVSTDGLRGASHGRKKYKTTVIIVVLPPPHFSQTLTFQKLSLTRDCCGDRRRKGRAKPICFNAPGLIFYDSNLSCSFNFPTWFYDGQELHLPLNSSSCLNSSNGGQQLTIWQGKMPPISCLKLLISSCICPEKENRFFLFCFCVLHWGNIANFEKYVAPISYRTSA